MYCVWCVLEFVVLFLAEFFVVAFSCWVIFYGRFRGLTAITIGLIRGLIIETSKLNI